MSLWRQLALGMRALVRRQTTDDELTDEVRHYMDLTTAAYVARGYDRDAARRAAQLEVGNMTVVRERVRAYGWENIVAEVLGDVRFAARRLRANPGFTVVSVLTLALGIGATTAIFSAVNPILLASLPYPRAEQLVVLDDRGQDGSPRDATFGTYAELRARSRSFQSLTVVDRWQPSLTGTNEPERLQGQRVSASYFRVLGVAPAVGRDFADADDQVGGPRVAVLSDRLVQRRFGGDRSLVGRTVKLDDNEYLVIGIMPPRFANVLAPAVDIWAPLQERARADFNSREWGHHYRLLGRLDASVSPDRARREIDAIGRAAVPEFPRPLWANMSAGLLVRPLRDAMAGEARPMLLAIVGAVIVLLAIVCVNVTNLLVARAAQRRGEFAMRVALGAGRGRLLRQVLTESVLLAGIGGVCGLAVANVGVGALVALSPPGLPRIDAIGLNGPVFAFALIVSALVGLTMGVIPAVAATRTGLQDGLQHMSRRTAGKRGIARNVLVVTEVALALILLVGAGLLMRSLERLFAVAPGFTPSRLLTMQVIDPGRAYRGDTARRLYYERVAEAVRHVPGVTAVALTSQLPLSGDVDGYGYEFQSTPSVKAGEDGSAFRYAVTPPYFATMGIPLRRGRLLDVTDVRGGDEAIVISESLARRKFGDQNPIGQRVRFGPETGSDRPWDVVVGVVGDVKQESLALGQTDAFYVAMGRWWWVDNVQSLVVRTSGDPAALAPSVKRAIWSVDANQPIERIVSMDALIERTASQRRFALVVIETFAFAALLLAAIGIYGVLSGSVTERMREIGVRSALGATRGNILGLIVWQGMALTLLGVVIGLCAAVAASRAIISLLFGVSRVDPVTYVGVVVLLAGVSMLACWLPAWRAARVDPAITLRSE
ncbi:MAG TPA: ABC transporter permease [Gemmatimonadaceae bacterium]|nr:ABC transporter permease [Gemmatimonadaceae bacterium]